MSNVEEENILNRRDVKRNLEEKSCTCGCAIKDMFSRWITYCNENGVQLADCSMWKNGIEGAFPLLFIRPE